MFLCTTYKRNATKSTKKPVSLRHTQFPAHIYCMSAYRPKNIMTKPMCILVSFLLHKFKNRFRILSEGRELHTHSSCLSEACVVCLYTHECLLYPLLQLIILHNSFHIHTSFTHSTEIHNYNYTTSTALELSLHRFCRENGRK